VIGFGGMARPRGNRHALRSGRACPKIKHNNPAVVPSGLGLGLIVVALGVKAHEVCR
jgi:hypothetical protein